MGHISPVSFGVATTLAAQRIVYVSAANTVAYPSSLQQLPIGITVDTVLDTTSSIGVSGPGTIAKLLFNDSVTAGGLVGADSSGRGVPITLANTTTSLTLAAAYVGVLVDAKVNTTAAVANVFICPGFDRVAG